MTTTAVAKATQYLTFKLDEEVFALDITKVREVLDYTTSTRVPRTPAFMRGVINLRGNVVPVIDLRLKFGMPRAEDTVNSCIIITEVTVDDGDRTVLGCLADSVQEVLDLETENIAPAPRIGRKLRTDFIKSMGKRGDRLLIILDIDRVFSCDELAAIERHDGGLLSDTDGGALIEKAA